MTISLGLRVPPRPPKSDRKLVGSLAGAARVKLPWLQDIILSGWGPFQSLGVRHAESCDDVPLCVRALVLEDPRGQRVALLALDLHGGSRYVAEKAAQELASEGFHAGNLFLSATHNHAGPGGLYGSQYYDAFAASTEFLKASTDSRLALNIKLANEVSRRVVEAVRSAVASLRPAQIGQSATWTGWARNRSLEAFRRNFAVPDDQLKSQLVEQLGSSMGDLETMAVDSRVHTIAAFEEGSNDRLIGSFSTFAAHCALLFRENKLQSPDFFGHATNAAEDARAATQGSRPVIALAAGAIGDCDPIEVKDGKAVNLDQWLKRREDPATNRKMIQRHAKVLADGLGASIKAAQTRIHPIERITVAFSEDRIAEAPLGNGKRMTDEPRIGPSTIAGSELGTGDARFLLFLHYEFSEFDGVETLEDHREDPQFPKRLWSYLGKYSVPLQATRWPLAQQYDRLGLRLVQLECRDFPEPIRLLGVPGEPTTWLTQQLNQVLRGTSPHRPTMVAGVTGDYQGYFTTRAEYDAQLYEGSSTIWGRETQTWLEEKVAALVEVVEGRRAQKIPEGEVSFNAFPEDAWRTELFKAPQKSKDGKPTPDGVWHLR